MRWLKGRSPQANLHCLRGISSGDKLQRQNQGLHKSQRGWDRQGLDFHEDLHRIGAKEGLKGRKLQKAMESYAWNITVLKGQADLLKHAKSEALDTLRQIHCAAQSCGLSKNGSASPQLPHHPLHQNQSTSPQTPQPILTPEFPQQAPLQPALSMQNPSNLQAKIHPQPPPVPLLQYQPQIQSSTLAYIPTAPPSMVQPLPVKPPAYPQPPTLPQYHQQRGADAMPEKDVSMVGHVAGQC
uniref:Uncharacterized protein n=1 Tax=Knipowitschia caucasica TaxID=637954 RepID=A0AAV2KJW1_KNICA